jgi:hypothetical protein
MKNEKENEKEFTTHAISNSTFGHYREQQKKIDEAAKLLEDEGYLVLGGEEREKRKKRVGMMQEELKWYRTYGEYINNNYMNVDAEACSHADGDTE